MVTEITTTSWGSRLGNSIKGILVGIVLFIASFALLWWNESRAVVSYQDINEMKNAAVEVESEVLSATNENTLVHLSANAVTDAELTDPEFGIAANAIALRRNVEMYQWVEITTSKTRKKMGGGTETLTEKTYETRWEDRLISSTKFDKPDLHNNPGNLPYGKWSDRAEKVSLGAFSLDPTLIRSLSFSEDLIPRPLEAPKNGKIEGKYLFFGKTAMTPSVGDVRVSFEIVPQGRLSVVARQSKGFLTPWTNSRGKAVSRIQPGDHNLEAMMAQAKREAQFLTWLLRGGGWLMMTIGLASVFKPLSVLGDVIPMIGSFIGGGIGIAAALISAVLSLITIGIAWVAVRPIIGVPLLVAAGGLLVWKLLEARKQTQLQ